MANGASRIFKFMQSAGTDTISEVVYLTVKSLNPLILNLENRLDITSEFIVLSDQIIKSKLKIGDKLTATTFNSGQCYYIQQAVGKAIKSEIIDNLSSNSSIDGLSAKQGKILNEEITKLKNEINSMKSDDQVSNLSNKINDLTLRITELENKIGG